MSLVLTLSSIPSLHPVSDNTPLPHLLFFWSITANRCCKLCSLATSYRSVSPRMRSFPALPPPLLFFLVLLATSPPALAPVCQRSKTGRFLEPIIHLPPVLSHRQLGWPQTNSITADNTAAARKEPNKWSLFCRPNGPAFHLARGQRSAQGLHGHNHQLLMRKTYTLQLAMTCMHHTHTHTSWIKPVDCQCCLPWQIRCSSREMFIVWKLHGDIWMQHDM